ncbi:AbrB family transcriptional regulator [Mesorhizobium sp. M7A.F.Ca.CA.001.09.2.1]|uniref:AbrB/MazE/SpoVT family DNA-binding domain-containing protein n=1 Tax=Mesorhizobium ciceri TaxID=39645 RepID=A0AB38T9C6_9HYPH|nr:MULTISPECIES: AbrB/MazE/SpoVT family DNA-binding domain-containing protein [Mesorhizobium]RVA70090.1 AbrB family transcriptional regulator [Mesorhizobium sp. M7A.F.Ca.CA.001.08.2.1]MDF3153315.1 AbrB/MazE/SpoVT family DNA-binding domain-containing protein [Mesorhizobium sp. XAP10]MDF3216076.1 AbrB/MazE/SpoVT family DNA-binding domain-containing protein [Mesorhizobium ciceri]MDF3246387.1 AbrB/MazE/SpoVT family DNA-binding domain-containing protein [Mesorhizobium sp. XAP4]RUY60857.1 AbrB famil
MKTTIHKLDDGSDALILPREMLDSLNLQSGDQLQIIETDHGIILRPVADRFERQMKAAREVMDKYQVGLQKLAK